MTDWIRLLKAQYSPKLRLVRDGDDAFLEGKDKTCGLARQVAVKQAAFRPRLVKK